MRDLVKVIDKMIAVVPPTETSFLSQLNSVRSSALYTSPETIGLRWNHTAALLQGKFAPDNEEPNFEPDSWEQKLTDIWMNKDGQYPTD